MRWYRNGETHRFEQTVGKQYTYGKGAEFISELEKLKQENRFLKQQLDVLKKYKEGKGGVTRSSCSMGKSPPSRVYHPLSVGFLHCLLKGDNITKKVFLEFHNIPIF
ncbi:hypothetical protein EGH10_17525 [Brevibacillus laterosporus]|nr:hypothetical protein DM460_09015 [Brevibacillus laterosporus]TPH07258.1 hypothetical protein EGH10_17525 [Brevibacillus laterosporus]